MMSATTATTAAATGRASQGFRPYVPLSTALM
jgi:hypothetical protein